MGYCLRGCWYEVMSSELVVDGYGLVGYGLVGYGLVGYKVKVMS